MTLEGRVALITGGGRGIGRAVSLALAEDGADIAVNYRRDKDAADDTVAAIRAMGRRAEAVPGAVDVHEDTQSMAAAAIAALGHVDILVNNAGIASRGRSVVSTDADEVEHLLRVNAVGPHWLCGAVLPSMREQPRGDIVFISSIATRHFQANGAPYSMGKAAMEALAFSLAKEERRHNIHTNIVAPGLVATEMGRRLVKGSAGVEDIGTLDAASPYGRVCRPEDVANVVRWLVSDGASYLNGERLYLDGNGVVG